jgi:serine/threonine-protein kinase
VTGSATDIFVSYKAEDRPRINPLVDALEADGFSIWWDAHISGGANWRRDIEEHLDAAKCVIVAWTKRSVGPEGEFVRDEAARARRHGTYLPICFDAVDPPLGFGEVQALSLKGWKGDRSDYRYLAVANALRSRVGGERSTHPVGAKPILSRRALLAGSVSAVVVAGASGWLLLKPGGAGAKPIAVLPFANLSGDPAQAYFSDGIAEELRSALTRVGMQVIGRSSCDAVKDLDIKAAASKLGVANILTGSVRRSPEMIRVDAQLVDGSDGVERWAQTYDRAPGDAIKIQTDIAANVAQALSVALGQAARAALTLGSTTDSVAQDLILQSRKLYEKNTREALHKCLALADAAIARDRNYADAYVVKAVILSGLASNFTSDAAEAASQLAMANEAANRGLAIAPELGSAHGVLARIDQVALDFPGSLEHLKRALALSPDDSTTLSFATTNLAWLGRAQEALVLADRFIALDPLNPVAYRRKSEVLYVLRQYAQSVQDGRKALELGSGGNARLWIGSSLLQLGRPREALAEFGAMTAGDPFLLIGEALVAARTGDSAGAERLMGEMKNQYGPAASYQYAQIEAQLGDKARAFAELDNALAFKDPGLLYLRADSFLDPIRNDPRYAALVRKLGFP